jgi:hypothetical protein
LFPKLYHEHAITIARKEKIHYVIYEKKLANWNTNPLVEIGTFGIEKLD